jgi:NAD(P)H-hydrate repair Nnr-like enzyme with NAD(P)H-hydrate dehydratase domain
MSTRLTAAERRERARIGGLARAAKYAGYDLTRAAREGRMRRYLHEVDPDGVLSQAERERRAVAARKRDMAKLTLASLRARSARRP